MHDSPHDVPVNAPTLGDEAPPIVEGASSPVPLPTQAWLDQRLRGALEQMERGKAHVLDLDREVQSFMKEMNETRGIALRGLAQLEGMIQLLREQGAKPPEELNAAPATNGG